MLGIKFLIPHILSPRAVAAANERPYLEIYSLLISLLCHDTPLNYYPHSTSLGCSLKGLYLIFYIPPSSNFYFSSSLFIIIIMLIDYRLLHCLRLPNERSERATDLQDQVMKYT
jgi:hypothetical protein